MTIGELLDQLQNHGCVIQKPLPDGNHVIVRHKGLATIVPTHDPTSVVGTGLLAKVAVDLRLQG